MDESWVLGEGEEPGAVRGWAGRASLDRVSTR